MKISIRKINRTIRSKKGETIIESIVSLLVLSVLLLAAATMIQAALRMTSVSTQNAKAAQDSLNLISVSEYSSSDHATITFSVPEADISAGHDIVLNKDGGIIAFSPWEE